MPFAAALSEHPLATHATGEAVGEVIERLHLEHGEPVDLAVVFVTAPHAGMLEDVAATVRAVLHPRALLGCAAVSVLAGHHEAEEVAAVSLFAAQWARAAPTAPRPVWLPEGADVESWVGSSPLVDAKPGSTLLLLADPFSVPIRELLTTIAERAPAPRHRRRHGLGCAGPRRQSARARRPPHHQWSGRCAARLVGRLARPRLSGLPADRLAAHRHEVGAQRPLRDRRRERSAAARRERAVAAARGDRLGLERPASRARRGRVQGRLSSGATS